MRCTLGPSDEWLFLTVQDKPRKTDEVATIEVYTDAGWAGDAKSMKSTSSVFMRIDGFIIGMNSQLQDTHEQSSAESEFYALGAGWRRRTVRECNPERSRHASQDQLAMRRQGSKSIGGETRFVQDEVPVRTRPRKIKRSRKVASSDRDEPGRHRHGTLAESQIGFPQEFDGEELRESDDVPNKATNPTKPQTTVSTDDLDKM